MSENAPRQTAKPSRPREFAPSVALFVVFGLIILGVPLAQAVIDVKIEKEDKPVFLTLFDQAPTEKNLRAFEKTLEQSSTVEQKLRPLFQYTRYRTLQALGEKALAGHDGWYFYTPGVRYLVEPYFRDLPKPPKTDPVLTLVDLQRQLKAHGVDLLVIPIPGKGTIYPDHLVSGLAATALVNTNTTRFINELRKKKIRVLNLAQVFRQARQAHPKIPLYMPSDTHWAGDGVKLAAATIAAKLRKMGWYQSWKTRRHYTRKRVVVKRPGDILKMTKIPYQETLFPKQKVSTYQVKTKAGELYEDAEDNSPAPILLLGDSFSRVFETDEPESAGLVANLAYELPVPVASIVNDGGASTLVRQALARDMESLAGKKLLIYTFVERDIRFGMKGWERIALWQDADNAKP